MRTLVVRGMLLALGMSTLGAQQAENMPKQITSVTLGDVRVRYLDFKWDEEAFEALEKGGDRPGAKRSWAIARLYPAKPIVIDGHPVVAGNLLILNPAKDERPMTLEVRVIDMREVWVEPNVVAEPPAGQTIHVENAEFKTVDELAERLTIALAEGDGTIKLSIHYGNRLATMEFERAP
jgi:hypothetical protein